MRARYEGTRLARQELYGEPIEDSERALVKREWMDGQRVERAPEELIRLRAIGLDPGGQGSQALCQVGQGLDGFLYVERSEMVRGSGADFLRHAIRLAEGADAMLVVERNFGGQYLQDLLHQVMRESAATVPVKMVWASVGKRARAEPVALLIEQGRVKWVGAHPALRMNGQLGSPTRMHRRTCSTRAYSHAPHSVVRSPSATSTSSRRAVGRFTGCRWWRVRTME
jgi:phage terminase large subunit-like protein